MAKGLNEPIHGKPRHTVVFGDENFQNTRI